jgi:anti-anti-sigma regulatory factor
MKFFLKITGRSKRVPEKQRAILSDGGNPAFSESLCVGLLLARAKKLLSTKSELCTCIVNPVIRYTSV